MQRKRFRNADRSRPTLADVASEAGVSTATVSRVLNRPGEVRDELRAKVEATISRLGYLRDGVASALASNKSRTIGASVPTLDSEIFASGINALERRLDEDGYTLFVAVSGYDRPNEIRQVRALMERGAAGILMIGSDHPPEVYDLLRQHQRPFAYMWTYDENSPHPCVGFDNVSAARQLTDYVLELGHRRVAMIAGQTLHNDRARHRVQGVRAALADRGLDLADSHFVEKSYGIWEGRHAARFLLDRPRQDRPTAIICGNDVLAFGCRFECLHAGLRVPGDISIAGFDDLPLCEHLLPGLTTVHVPAKRMGSLAAEFMIDSLAGGSPRSRVELPTQLVVRGSTGAPPADG